MSGIGGGGAPNFLQSMQGQIGGMKPQGTPQLGAASTMPQNGAPQFSASGTPALGQGQTMQPPGGGAPPNATGMGGMSPGGMGAGFNPAMLQAILAHLGNGGGAGGLGAMLGAGGPTMGQPGFGAQFQGNANAPPPNFAGGMPTRGMMPGGMTPPTQVPGFSASSNVPAQRAAMFASANPNGGFIRNPLVGA